MTTLQEAIYQQYGVKLAIAPTQSLRRVFKINDLHNGFLLSIGKSACFGSIIYGECFIYSGTGIYPSTMEHKENKAISMEWLIWEIARSTLERGERLGREDGERLALAVQRLEMWL